MAKSTGFTFNGTVNGLTMDRNGVVRKAQNKRNIKSPRTKENNSEFGTASKQGKVIRQALCTFGGDSGLSNRMLQIVRQGIALDTTNDRGKRVLSNKEAEQVLVGFELNSTNLSSIAPIDPRVESGKLIVKKIDGKNLTVEDICAPPGTTEIELIAVVAKINIAPLVLSTNETKVTSVKAKTGDLVLEEVEVTADDSLLTIVAVGIRFHQEANQKLNSLKNTAIARIVAVLPPV